MKIRESLARFLYARARELPLRRCRRAGGKARSHLSLKWEDGSCKRVMSVDYYFSAGSMIFQMHAASVPPTNGPTMNIQRLVSAVPCWKTAGAIERAGLTDVPV